MQVQRIIDATTFCLGRQLAGADVASEIRAAGRVQRVYRGHRVRHRYAMAAVDVLFVWRALLISTLAAVDSRVREQAAVTLQCAAREWMQW